MTGMVKVDCNDSHTVVVRKLVRSFSDDLEPDMANATLGKALKRKERDDKVQELQLVQLRKEWNTLLVSTAVPDTISIEEERLYQSSQRLAKAWQTFLAKLPMDQRPDVSQPPDLNMLRNAVSQAKNSWDVKKETTKRGKVQQAFENTMNRFHDHKDLLAIIPADDKYVCLLTGSLSAIAKATMNHATIAEEIAATLDSLDDDMDYWKRQMKVHKDNIHLRLYVIRLFVIVFEMLADIFQSWYASKWDRFKHSFDSGFFERTVASKKAAIQGLKMRLENESSLTTQQTVQENQRTLKEIQRTIQDLPSREEAEAMTEAAAQRFWLRIQDNIQLMLREQGIQQLKAKEQAKMIEYTTGRNDVLKDESSGSDVSSHDQSKTSGPSVAVAPLVGALPMYMHEHVYKEVEQNLIARSRREHLEVDMNVFRAIQGWSLSTSAACLWIEGPHDVAETPSQNTLTAASLLAAARSASLPAVAYFCGQFRKFTGKDDFQAGLLRDMMLSLIAQMWEYRMPMQPAKGEALASKVAIVDRDHGDGEHDDDDDDDNDNNANMPSLEALVEILQLLVESQPDLLHVFVDGLQFAEDKFDETYAVVLQRIVDCLSPVTALVPDRNTAVQRSSSNTESVAAASTRPFKTCFTTDGCVDILQDAVIANRVEKVFFEFESEHRLGRDGTAMRDVDLFRDD